MIQIMKEQHKSKLDNLRYGIQKVIKDEIKIFWSED